jgi:DNA polymerase-4
MAAFCRDCLADAGDASRCSKCYSPRILRHGELDTLTICHVDCDAFYATIEKRDDPTLADKPLIIGGGKRGVVSTACYIARTFGVRSAMPMFEAKRLCPHATVVRPNMEKYSEVSRRVRALMLDMTPLVEPISIDEAFMDLSGTARLHGMIAAKVLARFAARVEKEIGITVSIGLAANKFLAKIASDLDKPRGFAVLGQAEAVAFLADKPVSLIFGVGKVAATRLAKDGYRLIADLQRAGEHDLLRRYGAEGQRLHRLARGIDAREIDPVRERKSVSAENTFETDIASFRPLEKRLWAAADEVADRLKEKHLCGSTVTLKLKTSDFRILTRARSLENPTQLAGKIFGAARELLEREINGTRYRLLGVGVSALADADAADPADLIDRTGERRAAAERAMDRVRGKFGPEAVVKGLSLEEKDDPVLTPKSSAHKLLD